MRKSIQSEINKLVAKYNVPAQDLIEEAEAFERDYEEIHDRDATCAMVIKYLRDHAKGKYGKGKRREYTAEEKAAYKAAKKDKLKETVDLLDRGVKEIFTSGRYQEYLKFCSTFHNYSYNNQLLILLQNPEAKYVAGYRTWEDQFNRHVIKGQKGIAILAPNPVKITKTEEDENGEEVEKEIRLMRFRTVYVFGDNQTEGDPLPEICTKLEGDVENGNEIRAALEKYAAIPIDYSHINGTANGYFVPSENRIVVNDSLSEKQTIKTLVHEIAHSKLHGKGCAEENADNRTMEVQAESVAFVVSNYLGIDTSDYSFGYVAGWAGDKELKQLKASLDIISKTAKEMIEAIAAASAVVAAAIA